MSICLGHTSYVELAQVKFYKNLPPYSHCVWQKSSATSPSFARKNWMPCDSLGCRDFGTSKNPVVQTAIVMSTCSEKHESQLREFSQISQHLYDKVCFFFFKGWVSPLLSQPGFFLKSSILTWCFRPVTLGHLFQRLGHLRRSLRMASQVVFIGEMVYIYIYDQQPLLLKQRYIYIYVF